MNFDFLLSYNWNWHLKTIYCIAILFAITLVHLFVLFLIKQLTVYVIANVFDFATSLFCSIIIFRTFYLHFAIIIWCIVYILIGIIEKKHRIIYSLNSHNHNPIKNDIKLYNDMHNFKRSDHFIDITKNYFKFMNLVELNNKFNSKFLPFRFFAVGLIIPSLNLVLEGSQYQNSNSFLLIFENYIFLFTFLYWIYPITYFLTVKLETSKMYECKTLFHICYILFSFVLLLLLTVIPILGK